MKKWWLVIIWASLIFLGSCLPGASVSEFDWLDFLAHKIVHLFEYAVLAILLLRAFGFQYHRTCPEPVEGSICCTENRKIVVAVLGLCFLYGLTDEWHQSFTFGREARLRDAFIDLLGGFLGIMALWKLPQKASKKLLSWGKSLPKI